MTPADIQRLLQQAVIPDLSASRDDHGLTAAQKAQRTASLQQVLLSVQQYWMTGSQDVDLAAELLADSSRDASWRIPIGESGLLVFFAGIISVQNLRQSLKIHALRLIGNSCADEDENRARIVAGNHIGQIVSLLHDDGILAFVIPVLYNICVDYEPAQLQACQAQLSCALVAILSGPRLAQCRAFLDIICKILGLLVAQEPEMQLADPTTPIHLLRLASSPETALDTEELSFLLSVALSYLANEKFQEELIRQGAVQTLLSAFWDTYRKIDIKQLDPDDAADLMAVRNRFTHTIADVLALPSFLSTYSLTSPVVQTLHSWVCSPYTEASVKATACIALGNLARSDQSSIYFVRDLQIHIPLIHLLSKPSYAPADGAPEQATASSQLTYSILSFLKNLAIPAANKPLLGALLDTTASILPRIWTTTDTQPQVQFAAVSLTRLLLVSCPENVRLICSPLSPDPSSPAHDRSNLHVLTIFFKRVDAENTKTEAARAISAVCRVLHSSPDNVQILPDDWDPPEEPSLSNGSLHNTSGTSSVAASSALPSPVGLTVSPAAATLYQTSSSDSSAAVVPSSSPTSPEQSRRVRFYASHLDVADGLTYLMMQTKFPVLRSETWFVCALMSRSAEGAQLVMRALQPFEACRALVEAVSGIDMVDGHSLPGSASLASGAEAAATAAAAAAAAADGSPPEPKSPVPRSSLENVGTDTLPAESPLQPSTSAVLAGLGLDPQQADPSAPSMARVDRENGLILISEIMKNYAHFQPPFRRGMFEDILRTGGAVALHSRALDKETTQ